MDANGFIPQKWSLRYRTFPKYGCSLRFISMGEGLPFPSRNLDIFRAPRTSRPEFMEGPCLANIPWCWGHPILTQLRPERSGKLALSRSWRRISGFLCWDGSHSADLGRSCNGCYQIVCRTRNINGYSSSHSVKG